MLSFTELVPKLFSISGVKVFLSEHLSQDPLEKFFGCQRQRGGTHDNPSVQEFCKNTQALRVINTFCRGPVRETAELSSGLLIWKKKTFRFQNGEESNKDGSTSVYLHYS